MEQEIPDQAGYPIERRVAVMPLRWTLLAAALAATLHGSSDAATIYVAADGSGDAPTLQAAVDRANPCDEIVVGPGRYTWDNQTPRTDFAMVFFDGDVTALRIRSEQGAKTTILDAQHRGRILHITGERLIRKCLDGRTHPSGEPQPLLIDGFTFINGEAPEFGDYTGGAIAGHLSSAIVRNCIFRDNHAANNGGAYWWGGVSTARVENCIFENNTSRFGGAVFLINSVEPIEFHNNVFLNNRATLVGGAIAAFHAQFHVVGALCRGNEAGSSGAVLYANSVWPSVVKNSALLENSSPGGIIRIVSQIEDDRGNPESDIRISNSVIAWNPVGTSINRDFRGKLHVECTNIFGNRHGDWNRPLDTFLELPLNNSSADPRICSSAPDTLAVCSGSPLLRANNPCGVPWGRPLKECEDCLDRSIEAVRLHQNRPNPFNPRTTIAFELSSAAPVLLEILDLRGRRVRLLADRNFDPGYYETIWSGKDDAGEPVASGVYPLRLRVGTQEQRGSLVLLR